MAAIRFLFGIIITVCIALFALLNREVMSVTWNPLSDDVALMLPAYVVILVSMAVGFIFGGFLVWMNMGGLRKIKRKQKRDIQLLETEVGRLKDDKLSASMPATDLFPALPVK
ncbi:MAG: hypothetical protein COA45_08880 [Zetaproteobacteria bacterium]|nr:MAG: hypothetical protein COA45_08880 [Zetaproteobacteria bacterium]